MIRILSAFAAAAVLGACASASTVAARPLDSGTMKEFAAPAAKVSLAAKATVAGLGYLIESEQQSGPSSVLQFSKGADLFSWGEVGRVVVTPVGEAASKVYVDTEKVSQMQITGTNEAQFSTQIFDGITTQLAK